MIERRKTIPAPVVVVSPGRLTEDLVARYNTNNIPVFSDLATCFDSLRCVYVAGTEGEPIAHLEATRVPLLEHGAAMLKRAVQERKSFLPETESAEVLRSIGVPVVASAKVGSFAEAQAAADDVGYPIVLKALPPGVAHKSKLGLVFANVDTAEALRKSYLELERRIAAQGHTRANVPIIVQRRLLSKAELIVGVSHERSLGHFLVAGLGGIYAEVLDEVVLLPIPVSASTILRRLSESRLGRLLGSMSVSGGGNENADFKGALLKVLDALQQLILHQAELIESIDINPLLVTEDGCTAVDALIVP